MEAIDIARRAVQAASDKQASNIVLLDTSQTCFFTDYFVICSGESDRQIEAILEGISKALKKEGITPHHHEGDIDSGWVLLDFGAVIVHIFAPPERDYYQLEELWSRATPTVRAQ